MKHNSIHYNTYLQLDKVLDAQNLRSEEMGEQAHDEMLFIITHQVYELWFKQIIHELDSVYVMFGNDKVDERSIGVAVARLKRITAILKVLIEQIKILETMTPLDFLDFRGYLFPASGFQSYQFRKMEVLLGLKDTHRHSYQESHYTEEFENEKKDNLLDLESSPSLLNLISDWLERTPFLQFMDFDFIKKYKEAVDLSLEKDKNEVTNTSSLSEKDKKQRLMILDHSRLYFDKIFDQSIYEKMVEEKEVSLSYKATLGALFINLYRDEPILHMPYNFLSELIEIDESLTTWRYRHAQMVMRMLGRKVGTGGSSGHDYLKKTAEKHHIFSDLHNVSTFLIPRSYMPPLPDKVKKSLAFHFTLSE